MEASENAGTSPEGGGGSALHRIDRERVARMVREGVYAPGFERLGLMVSTIIPRLQRGGPTTRD
jgi:hypothetical protein